MIQYREMTIIENPGGSYSWFGCVFLTLPLAKRAIDKYVDAKPIPKRSIR